MTRLPDGLYDRLLNSALERALHELPEGRQAQLEKLGRAEQRRRLVLEVSRLLPEILDAAADPEDEAGGRELALINELLVGLRQEGAEEAQLVAPLRALRAIHPNGAPPTYPPTGLSAPWLFTAGRVDPVVVCRTSC